MNRFDQWNSNIRNSEASLVNLLSAIAPWGAPLAPAYMAYGSMTGHLGFVWWVALALAFVIEILGLATVHTTLLFWQHNRRYKMEYKKQPTALAAGMFGLYLLIILIVNIILEAYAAELITWAWTPIVARGFLSLLAVPAAVTMAIRTQHTELLRQIKGNQGGNTEETKKTHDAPVMRALPAHICAQCGEVCGSQQALAAHMRWQHANGKSHLPSKKESAIIITSKEN